MAHVLIRMKLLLICGIACEKDESSSLYSMFYVLYYIYPCPGWVLVAIEALGITCSIEG